MGHARVIAAFPFTDVTSNPPLLEKTQHNKNTPIGVHFPTSASHKSVDLFATASLHGGLSLARAEVHIFSPHGTDLQPLGSVTRLHAFSFGGRVNVASLSIHCSSEVIFALRRVAAAAAAPPQPRGSGGEEFAICWRLCNKTGFGGIVVEQCFGNCEEASTEPAAIALTQVARVCLKQTTDFVPWRPIRLPVTSRRQKVRLRLGLTRDIAVSLHNSTQLFFMYR